MNFKVYIFSNFFSKFLYMNFFQNFFQNFYIDNNSSENLHTLLCSLGNIFFNICLFDIKIGYLKILKRIIS